MRLIGKTIKLILAALLFLVAVVMTACIALVLFIEDWITQRESNYYQAWKKNNYEKKEGLDP